MRWRKRCCDSVPGYHIAFDHNASDIYCYIFSIRNNSTNTMQSAKFVMITKLEFVYESEKYTFIEFELRRNLHRHGLHVFSTILRQIGFVQCRHCTLMLIVCVSVKHNIVHLQSGRNFIEGLFSRKFQPWAWHYRLEIHVLSQNFS